MPLIRLDFSQVSDDDQREFPVHEPGEYPGKITAVTQKVGKSSGKPYLEVEGKLQAGGKCWSNYSLQPQALWKIKQLLVRLGIADELDLEEEFDFDPDSLINKDALFVLTIDDSGSKPRNQVVDIKAIDDTSGGW